MPKDNTKCHKIDRKKCGCYTIKTDGKKEVFDPCSKHKKRRVMQHERKSSK